MKREAASPEQQFNVNQKSSQVRSSLPKVEPHPAQRLFIDVTGTSDPVCRTYEDKRGLSATCDAATSELKKQVESDAFSMLWHELLSPLTLIKGYTATLLQLDNVITKEQKEQYLRGIESANNRIIHMLENLRDVNRLEETGAIITQSISLPDLLRRIASEMQSQTTKHIIKILPSARLPRVKTDPEKIEMVVNNLLINAVKYSPQGGDIEAEIRLVRNEQELRIMFGDTPPVMLPCLIMSIADNGIGIPEEELDRIFEKFYRVNNKLTPATPGAGLGLYICKIIVEAYGGHIWARSRLQGGSIFSFSLPLN